MVSLAKGPSGRGRGEAGQTLVETALVVPMLVLFLAMVVDAGRFMFLESNVGSAADSLARQVESAGDLTPAQAMDYLAATFPDLAQGASVSIGRPRLVSEELGYRVYDDASGTFKERPSAVSQDKIAVTVAYDGEWLAPGLVTAAELLSGAGGIHIERTAMATVDTTLETW